MSVGNVVCRECDAQLFSLDQLCLLQNDAKLYIQPKEAASCDSTTLTRSTAGGAKHDVLPGRYCRKCDAKVVRSQPDAVAGTVYEVLKAEAVALQFPDGRRHETKNWTELQVDLDQCGVRTLTEREFLEQAGVPNLAPPREGNAVLPTVLVDLELTSKETLESLTRTGMRNYQLEMVEFSLQRNSLVCLPAGSGKTRVSAAVIAAMVRLNPQKIAVFVVTTNSLMEQQSYAVENEIPAFKVVSLSGQMDPELRIKNLKLVNAYKFDILVCTCACMNRLLEIGSLRVSDLCCLVLDEVHQTKGASEYAKLVQSVQSSTVPRSHLPLMLGLTASPLESVKLSDKFGDLYAGVSEIAERLQCHPCFPSKENDPYNNGMAHTEDVAFPVETSGKELEFERELDKYMALVVRSVKGHLGSVAKDFDTLDVDLSESSTLDTNAFRGKVRNISKKLHAERDKPHFSEDETTSVYYGLAVVDHLYQILTVHEINDVIGHETAMDQLRKVFEDIEDPVAGQQSRKKEILYCLRKDFRGKPVYDDLYTKLKSERRGGSSSALSLSAKCRTVVDLIRAHYRTYKNESRILVFVLMRRVAKKLCACLSNMDVIRTELNPQVIVGRGIRGDGLTVEEQQEVLSDFRKGRCRLVITTAILEEGLDVPTCNMVLRMKAPENLREFVQSRGRACRSERGKFKIICRDKAEALKQQHYLTCMEEQTKAIRQMMEEPNSTLGALRHHERAVLDLSVESGRPVHQDDGDAPLEDNGELDAERMAEMLRVFNQADAEPDQRFLEDFDREVAELPVRFAFFSEDDESYRNESEAFKRDLAEVYSGAELRNWTDIVFPAENQLGTRYYAEATIVGADDGGVEEFQRFEKEILELFMSDIFRSPGKYFWVSRPSTRTYFPWSTSLQISLHQVSVGSLKSPQEYVQRLALGKASFLRVERGRERIVLTVDDSFQVEATFADLQDFALVDRYECGDGVPLICLYVTFSQTPRLSEIRPQTEEERMQIVRVVEYPAGTRQIFTSCLTYKLEIPNPRNGTGRCAIDSRIRQVLRLIESAGVTVYYTSVKTETPREPLLPEDRAFSGPFVPHGGSKRISYAMMCLRSAPGFVQDRLDHEFYRCLDCLTEQKAKRGLYGLAKIMSKNLFCDPLKWLPTESERHLLHEQCSQIRDHAFIKRAIITPTGIRYYEPELVQTNRVVREHDAAKFIRVHIRDEDTENLTSLHGSLAKVMRRILEVMTEGLKLDDVRYHYLAASNSQTRAHSCYFIEDDGHGIAEKIRYRIGDLSGITNVASYASRLGLGFSTSNRTISVYSYCIESDLENEKYTFTDGVGLIATSVAEQVQQRMGLDRLPSAFQIRLGGCKGMLSVWHDKFLDENDYPTKVVVRDSMLKYPSDDKGLEVLEYTRPLPLHLNQQVIMLLSNLGVGDDIFMDLLRNDIANMGKMFVDEREAETVLVTLDKAKVEPLRRVRYRFTSDPYFRHLMMAHYKRRMKDVREKSRVRLDDDKGRVLLGVMDETETLKYGEVFIQISEKIEQQIRPETRIITSKVVIMKNPCLHPGDVRTFRGRDVPALRHLVDCVVFPAKGPRPHPNELSGSDLDGDQYHCIWDDRLMPKLAIKDPMDYTGAEKEVERDPITVERVLEHMCAYIEKDTLGMIDNTHKALADQKGIESDVCLELAEKHALAVDAPKTGNWQEIPPDIKSTLRKYPDFMMKKDKPSYPSPNVLGEMFRECSKYMSDTSAPSLLTEISCPRPDRSFEVPGYKSYMADAKKCFEEYNQHLHRIMMLYGIETEAELLSGSISTVYSRLKDDIDDIQKCAKELLRDVCTQYWNKFFDDPRLGVGARELEEKKKAAAWYYVTYSSNGDSYTVRKEKRRFLSFPWIVSDILAKIYSSNTGNNRQPVRSLHTHISDSVKDIFDGSLEELKECFRQHTMLLETIAQSCRRVGRFMLFGLSSLMLFDEHEGRVSILAFRERRSRKDLVPKDQLSMLEHVRNDARSLFVHAATDRDRGHLDVRVNRRLPKRRARLTADMGSVLKWIVIKKYFFKFRWLLPTFRVLCSWMSVSGLVGGKVHFLSDELVPLLFIDHCLKKKELDPIPFGRCYAAAQEFLQDPIRSEVFGSQEEWDRLLKELRESEANWEGSNNSGKAGRILCLFMESGEGVKESDIHPEIAPLYRKHKWCEVESASKMELLVSEMKKASHRLSLHVNASVLLAKVPVERVFSIEMAAAKELAGDEDGLTRMLHQKSGARVDVQTSMRSDRPGMIVRGAGTEAELHLLNDVIDYLNARATDTARTKRAVRVRGYKDVTGAHNLLVEGATPENNLIALEPYLGFKHPQHDHKSLYVIRLTGRSQQISNDPCSTDVFDAFRKHFKSQLAYFERHYDEQVSGPAELQVKFGRTYVINPPDSFVEDSSYLTTEELTKALERRKLRVTDPMFDSGTYRQRSYNTGPSASSCISSAFISAVQLDNESTQHLKQRVEHGNAEGTDLRGTLLEKGVKMMAETGTGMVTARYDQDLKFCCLETSPIRWIVSDLKKACHLEGNSVEGRECDIRFMLKSQHSEKDQLEDHALAVDFEGAIGRREGDGKLCLMKDDLHVEYMEDYVVLAYEMKLRFSIPCVMIIRRVTQYSRRLEQEFGTIENIEEVRLVPELDAFKDHTTVDSALDALWSEAFVLSNGLKFKAY